MSLFRDTCQNADEPISEVSGSRGKRRSRPLSHSATQSIRDLQPKSDAALIEDIKAGQKQAYDVLVARHQPMVIASLLRMMDLADAQDVAQEAFIKAYRSLGSFRGDSQFATWLYRIARNTAMNHLKLRRRRPGGLQIETLDGDQPHYEEAAIDRNTPEDFVIADELQQLLQHRMGRMKPDLREAILCYEIEGMSYQEIAERMECPVGTIRSRISRGREILNKDLCAHGYDPLSHDFARRDEPAVLH